jgi:hypothetical protein
VSGLSGQAAEYLQVRRALGFKLEVHGWLLSRFAAFADAEGAQFITFRPADPGPAGRAAQGGLQAR